MTSSLPKQVTVKRVVSSRYGIELPGNASRPLNWDDRREGIDIVETSEGEKISLLSDGQQSVPQPGWVLILTKGDPHEGFRYTLYGMGAVPCASK